MGIHGERLFGRVHRVPGLFYVATMFFHFNFVPMWPLRSFLVQEGSDHGDAFEGVRIPMSFRSVVAGYMRGWLAAAAIFAGIVGAFATTAFYVGSEGVGLAAALAAGAAVFGVFWFVFNTRTWWFLPVQLALLAGSAVVYLDVRARVPDAERLPPEARRAPADRRRHDASYIDVILYANAAAVLYTLTRVLTPCSYRRALELARHAAIPAEAVASHFADTPTPLHDDPGVSSSG
jgi:hypothetical protein